MESIISDEDMIDRRALIFLFILLVGLIVVIGLMLVLSG